MSRRILLVTTLLLLFIELNFAAIPQKISYQGVLKNSSTGIAVPDGNYSMTFALYGGSLGTSQLWSETQGSVPVALGVFSVILGSVTPIPTTLDYNNQLFLGISFNGGAEMTPRVALNMAPYSSNTTAIQGYAISSAEPKAGNLLRFNGTSWEPTKPEVAVCRWNVFDTFEVAEGKFTMGDVAELFCGVKPSVWNLGAKADAVTLEKKTLRNFFNRKCYAKDLSLIHI